MRKVILLLLASITGTSIGFVVGPESQSAQVQDADPPEHVQRALYKRGKTVFLRRCAVCHGDEADGKGVLAQTIPPPKPRNFRDADFTEVPADSLRRIIVQGGKAVGLNPRMPAWGEELTEQKVDAVIAFIRSVSRFGHVPTEHEVQQDPWFVE